MECANHLAPGSRVAIGHRVRSLECREAAAFGAEACFRSHPPLVHWPRSARPLGLPKPVLALARRLPPNAEPAASWPPPKAAKSWRRGWGANRRRRVQPGRMRCKPSSVPPPPGRGDGGDDHLSGRDLAAALCLSASGLPAASNGLDRASPLLGLARGGVCRAGDVTAAAVRSYRTFSPLPFAGQGPARGGLFSVALSRSRRVGTVGVTHHRGPAVLGLSSPGRSRERPSTHPTNG